MAVARAESTVREAIDAASKAAADGQKLVDKTRADFGLEEHRDYPLTRAWKRGEQLQRSAAGAPAEALPALLQMAEEVIAFERSGRPIAAALGLTVLREQFEAVVSEAADAWNAFVSEHLPIGFDRVNQLLGDMVHRGAVLRCPKCSVETTCACSCGVPYVREQRWAAPAVSALDRAAAAVAAHPEKSNRAIAGEIGVSFETVRRARAKAESARARCVTDVSADAD